MPSELPKGRRKRPLRHEADRQDALDRLTRLAPPASARGGWTPPRSVPRGRHSRSGPAEAAGGSAVEDEDGVPYDQADDRSAGPGLMLRLAVRFGVTRRQVLLVVILAAIACVFAAVQAFQHRARVTDVPVTFAASTPAGSTSPAAGAAPTAAALVVVHVVGRVARPGLVRLPIGSRVKDAVTAAGGPVRGADLSTLNLARVLTDGEQVVVGDGSSGGVSGSTPPPNAAGQPSGTGLVNLNSASLEQLDGLPHIGPVLAQRILDFRIEHGRFSSVDELNEVSGIGEKTFADLKPLVTV